MIISLVIAYAINTFINNNSCIPILNGQDFLDWKDKILLIVDLAFHVNELHVQQNQVSLWIK